MTVMPWIFLINKSVDWLQDALRNAELAGRGVKAPLNAWHREWSPWPGYSTTGFGPYVS